ncbi:hypothetical protein [Sphingomonas sp. BK036]|uniref:hypothetical protein n=1 Tax=Sphingomonas sp. BK036 TaxID=2512122 RepID=UPI0010296455|nr:hypothetical protein [Sphingomonas sp. BK036]
MIASVAVAMHAPTHRLLIYALPECATITENCLLLDGYYSHQGWPDRPTPFCAQRDDCRLGHEVTVDIHDDVAKFGFPVRCAPVLIEHVILRSIR